MTIAAAADEAGDLTHRGIRINSNGGSYAAHTHAVAAYAVTSNFQTYKASAVQIGESSTVYTNLPSAAAMRGYGIPQLNFAMESQMEDIARRNGWTRLISACKISTRRALSTPLTNLRCEPAVCANVWSRGGGFVIGIASAKNMTRSTRPLPT